MTANLIRRSWQPNTRALPAFAPRSRHAACARSPSAARTRSKLSSRYCGMAGEGNGTAPACRGLIREVEPRVDVFGRVLFRTQDLDPIYVALLKTARDDQLHRWLVAYWLFYNAGAASWLSEREGKDFWDALMVAAKNETPTPFNSRWPRGAEPRHFRGGAAVSAGDALQRRYARPEDMVAFLLDGPMDIRSVIARARRHHQVGSWLAFKITDMIDAVLGAEVKQDDLTTFLYDTPRQ